MKKTKKASILAIVLIAITVGGLITGSLIKYVMMDNKSIEKEAGHIKASGALKLASSLYNTSLSNNPNLSTAQITSIEKLIGGGATNQTIFGSSSSSVPSLIPGFSEYQVTWNSSATVSSNVMSPPDTPNGFWFFPGSYTAAITSLHSGPSVPTFRNNSEAALTSTNQLRTVPVFSMLSFYDRDWEVSAHYESAQIVGHVHSNGNIYLDCRDSGPDRIRFHGLQNYPILTADKTIFRRGRNGETSRYLFSSANYGLDFLVHSSANFSTLIDSDYNFVARTDLFFRDLTPDYTNYYVPDIPTDNTEEKRRRRFGGEGADFGYVFTGSNGSTDFNAPSTVAGTTVAAVQFGNAVSELTPPVAMNPYQYIEDIQFTDTPDTINYSAPNASNYTEDAANSSQIAGLAYNAIAPLVIRDGVAYYRTTVGGDLTPVINLLSSNSDAYYPDDTHPDAKKYGDLRWYGWFGMNDGVLPTPENPARWHFPVKSVTFNATNNTTSSEGSAVAFTFRDATVHNPKSDGDSSLSADWIDTSMDLDGLTGYPALTNANATDTNTGAGVGMYNVSYPTIDTGGIELYDPVRVAYNIVKAKVRKMYNKEHIFTSRHNGMDMLNIDGTDPGAGNAPNIWGAGIMAASFGAAPGIDYNNDSRRDFSAFWNDDGGWDIGPGAHRYLKLLVTAVNGGTGDRVYISEAKWTERSSNIYPPGPVVYVYSGSSEVQPVSDAFDNNINTDWITAGGSLPASMVIDSGATATNWIDPVKINLTMSNATVTSGLTPKDFEVQISDDGTNYTTVARFTNVTWAANVMQEFSLKTERLYRYVRDIAGNTVVSEGRLELSDLDDTSRVELFPIRHISLTNASANGMNRWYIYKSTLPFSDRTLAMPTSRNNLNGWDYNLDVYNTAHRQTNFGYPGNPTGDHNWFTLLNNAPEMLARSTAAVTFETPAAGFSYYAGDCGGYYGVDNLSMIDLQEKKIVVFTEIDLAELTPECFQFNGLNTAWGFNFNTNTATVNSGGLQNIIYVLNTSMGKNFFGKRVHCGAVRLKRGRLIQFPLSIASPNAVHVWGDYNMPGYWHHGKGNGSTSVSYTVPTQREHIGTTISMQPCAIYADSISAYENSWIPFKQNVASRDMITDTSNGTLQVGSVTYRTSETICFDHKLWWEDDGMRREGNGTTTTGNGAQLFLNYHEMIFNHNNNDVYKLNSAWGDSAGANTNNRGSSNQIWKHIPQGISAGLMYGNVESRLPSYFYNVDVTSIPLARPTGVDELDWYMSFIPRSNWIELERNQMRDDLPNTLMNGGFDPTNGGANPEYYDPTADLTPSNYFGTNFPGSGDAEFENCKLKFSGGGFMYDIRFHTNHTHNLPDPVNNGDKQNYGKNILGAFACLFDSRQSFHGFNNTMLGTENQQTYNVYNLAFNTATNLPPGTPMTTIVPSIQYSLEGSKWEY